MRITNWKRVITLILILSMIILPMQADAKNGKHGKNTAIKEIFVANPNFYDNLTIAKDTIKRISIGFYPKSASNKKLTWKSDDSNIADVSSNGVITGIKNGKTKITVAAMDGSNQKLMIPIIVGTPVKSVTVAKKQISLSVNEAYEPKIEILPKNADNKKIIFKSENAKIAKVTQEGKITGVCPGKTVISVVAGDGSGRKAFINIQVKSAVSDKTLTGKDVKNGTIQLTNVSYQNLYIDNSVGNATIVLKNVKINGDLKMKSNSAYTVRAINSKINHVIAIGEASDEIQSFAVSNNDLDSDKTPTFEALVGTVVISIDAKGNVAVKQDGNAQIGIITVKSDMFGHMELKLDGYKGKLEVNTSYNADISIITADCNISEVVIDGITSVQKITLTDDNNKGQTSNIEKINIKTNAKVEVNTPVDEVMISAEATAADVMINKPVSKVTNRGQSTKLSVNSNIKEINSNGEAFNLKAAAGSQISEFDASGNKTIVEVAPGSSISKAIIKGNDSKLEGSGSIGTVSIEGNNNLVTDLKANVLVANKASGTIVNGKTATGGTTVTSGTSSNISVGGSGNQGGSSSGDPGIPVNKVIKINDPGELWPGTPVQMTADTKKIEWYVFNNIDESDGEAIINKKTGILTPQASGTIRVVAVIPPEYKVYGAVDIDINKKKFVGYEPFDPIVFNEDKGCYNINSLEKTGLLPKKINLIYETGKASETEVVPVNLEERWLGSIGYGSTGLYSPISYFDIPKGYECPDNIFARVYVYQNAAQTQNRKEIVSYQDKLEPLVIEKDENLIYFQQLFDKYYNQKKVKLTCSDGTVIECSIIEGFNDTSGQYNGAVPGTYHMEYIVDIPDGYYYYFKDLKSDYVSFYEDEYLIFYGDVIIQTAQTNEEEAAPENSKDEKGGIPATTQPKYSSKQKKAVINSVNLSGVQTQLNAGQLYDFNKYVTVDTASELKSDHRVTWSVDGKFSMQLDSITGMGYFPEGDYNITATSVVDPSKSASIKIHVINTNFVNSFQPFNEYNVTEDLGISSFSELYEKLKYKLPYLVYGTDNTGKTVSFAVGGWQLVNQGADTIQIKPFVKNDYIGFNLQMSPVLTVNLKVPQSDNRIKVVSGSAINMNYTLNEDKYAVTEYELFNTLFNENSSNTFMVNALLDNGKLIPLPCQIIDYKASNGYYGGVGTENFKLYLKYPAGYRAEYPTSSKYDMTINIEVNVTANQTPRYEEVWISKAPKLVYNVGDTFDLSGITVRLRDTAKNPPIQDAGDGYEDIYINYADFDKYGIQAHLDGCDGFKVTEDSKVEEWMNGSKIYIVNTKNGKFGYIGPLTVYEIK